MPTAARLVAAILLTILGWCVGWIVMGRRAGRGFVSGINNGITGAAVMVLWGLAVHSSYEMFRLAMRNRYDGPMEALTAIFLIGSEFGIMIATLPVIFTFFVGALIAGPATEYAAKKWR